ncbi:MAG: ComA operon protein 2, partial [uncultured Actinomycetospora sp.]
DQLPGPRVRRGARDRRPVPRRAARGADGHRDHVVGGGPRRRHHAGDGQPPAVRAAARGRQRRPRRDPGLHRRGAARLARARPGRARALVHAPPLGPRRRRHRRLHAAVGGPHDRHVRDRDHRRRGAPRVHGEAHLRLPFAAAGFGRL